MDALRISDNEAAAVAVAPRVTLDSIESKIRDTSYYVHAGMLTICILQMANGFFITGESACASPANFNAELGRRIAREAAIRKAWAFEGYVLREALAKAA